MNRAGDLMGARQAEDADGLVEVRVALAGRPYDVLIGPQLSARSGDLIGRRLGVAKCAIVTDANVAAYHLEALATDLAARSQLAGTKVLPAGEASKSFSVLQELCESLLTMQLERGDLVLALGGGVIGDLAGF